MSQQTGSQNNSLEKTIAVTASLLYKTPAARHKPSNKAKANAITIYHTCNKHTVGEDLTVRSTMRQ